MNDENEAYRTRRPYSRWASCQCRRHRRCTCVAWGASPFCPVTSTPGCCVQGARTWTDLDCPPGSYTACPGWRPAWRARRLTSPCRVSKWLVSTTTTNVSLKSCVLTFLDNLYTRPISAGPPTDSHDHLATGHVTLHSPLPLTHHRQNKQF